MGAWIGREAQVRHLEAGTVAELGVVVGAAGAHIAHRVGEGARAAAHPRGSWMAPGRAF